MYVGVVGGAYNLAFPSFFLSSVLTHSAYSVSSSNICIVMTTKLRASTHKPTLEEPLGQSK